jgi:lipopolysaccharide export system permease protein
MKVLTRYLLRAHVGPFFFAFFALTGVILINTLARELAKLAGKGLSGDVVFQFFIYSLPANIALTFPMAVLVAVLYTFSQLAAENEVTALKAGGVDLRRMILPVLVAAGILTGTMIWFNDRVLPESNHQWRQLMADVARKSPLLTLRDQAVNTIPSSTGMPRYFLHAGHIDRFSNRLTDVVIYDLGDPQVSRTIYADSAFMAFNETRTDLVLRLYDGHVREINIHEPQQFRRLVYEQQVLRMPDVSNTLERTIGSEYRGDREMTVAMLRARIDTLQTELAAARADTLHAAGLHRVPMLERQIREYHVEVHKKFSIAAASLVFVLIGAPLAIRFPRGGVGFVIATSLGIFALYYVGLIGGETLADEGYVHPAVAMWTMNVVFGTIGALAWLRMGREQSTSRGGGGVAEGVVSLLRRPRRKPMRRAA